MYFTNTSEMPHLKIILPEPENSDIWHDVVAAKYTTERPRTLPPLGTHS